MPEMLAKETFGCAVLWMHSLAACGLASHAELQNEVVNQGNSSRKPAVSCRPLALTFLHIIFPCVNAPYQASSGHAFSKLLVQLCCQVCLFAKLL